VTDSTSPATPDAHEGHEHLDAALPTTGLQEELDTQVRDIAEVPAVELITTVAVHLMSAAAVHLGLAEEEEPTVAGLLTASLPYLGDQHARPLRDGLRSLQLAFREASPRPDAVGKGPGEDLTGPVFA
jgi:hypothetical protein